MAGRASKPSELTITSYQVGFGDCYLLSFHYEDADRHVLIDFGTKFRSKVGFKADMVKIANQIAEDCGRAAGEGGKLTMVVATHRHYDHISGFTTKKNGKGPGDIIRSLEPELVVQPWTEDPELPEDARAPKALARAHVRSLASMSEFAASVTANLDAMMDTRDAAVSAAADELSYLGSDNITNRSAVENLMTLGARKPKYLHLGSRLDVRTLLPGVKIHVLGPPTLDQNPSLKSYAKNSDQYWKLQALAARPRSFSGHGAVSFRGGRREVPVPARWFAHRLDMMRADSLLAIVRSLDGVINNTSLILLFEVGSKRLLFPGDAQVENWSSALEDDKIRKLLKDVDVYKVGHHGSRNATPIDLWQGFENRKKKKFNTFLSTLAGEYNEVPRESLADALREESSLHSTENFQPHELFERTTLKL
ncbi:MAG: hypothetical protein WB783_00015 [Arenicellales bacterium]